MQLASNTGQNDSSSVWGSGWLDTIERLGNTAGSVYRAVSGNGSTPATTPAASTPRTTAADWQKYALWGGRGLALLLVVGMVMRK